MKYSDLTPQERELVFLLELAKGSLAQAEKQRNASVALKVLKIVRGDQGETEETREKASRILEELEGMTL